MGMVFGESAAITHQVNGQDWEFYPLSVEGMFLFKRLYGPLGKAIALFSQGTGKDTASIFREVGEPLRDEKGKLVLLNGKAIKDNETIVEAISPELAKVRAEQRIKAVEETVDALTNDENKKAFAAIIIDSTRLRKKLGNDCPPPEALFSQIEISQIPEVLTGIGKANKGVFGPLTKTLSPLLAQVQGEVEKRLSETGTEATTSTGKDSVTQSSE